MGSLYDYFSAESDEHAASALQLIDGPDSEPGFDVVFVSDLDPNVQMITLEALLTGREFEEIIDGPRAGQILASEDHGMRMVVTLTDELQAALAAADDAGLYAVTAPWLQTDEFYGQDENGTREILASVLSELAELARRASSRGQRLYCWACV